MHASILPDKGCSWQVTVSATAAAAWHLAAAHGHLPSHIHQQPHRRIQAAGCGNGRRLRDAALSRPGRGVPLFKTVASGADAAVHDTSAADDRLLILEIEHAPAHFTYAQFACCMFTEPPCTVCSTSSHRKTRTTVPEVLRAQCINAECHCCCIVHRRHGHLVSTDSHLSVLLNGCRHAVPHQHPHRSCWAVHQWHRWLRCTALQC